MAMGLLVGGLHAEPFADGLQAYSRKDYAEAIRLWRPLAERVNGDAQGYLGVMYHNGLGVPQDYAEALKWFHLAAERILFIYSPWPGRSPGLR